MYNHNEIEKKIIKYWKKNKVNKFVDDTSKKKFYALDMFPYPSGKGLHVGHPKGYMVTDIVARYKRHCNFCVLHPIGWDAFGLPAEQYAIKTGNNPNIFTKKNIKNFQIQLTKLGFMFDYDIAVNTSDPNFFKWTQWTFLQMLKSNLAIKKDIDVNWCEELGTVLANEEVIKTDDGQNVSERGGYPVTKRPLKQWVIKITEYGDKLINDLNSIDWPISLKQMQINWIGKKIDNNNNVSWHLNDWVFSRQRYWGEPFPIAYELETNKIHFINKLPIKLPRLKKITKGKNGESPLANAKKWLYVTIDKKKCRMETDTMPQWAGSCWYYLGYLMKKSNTYIPLNSKKAYEIFKRWMPVDLYVGGQEHAVSHLLYSRFWYKFLKSINIVPNDEPFQKVVNQGIILGPDGEKMSKSKGNIINPDEIIISHGADTLRVYLTFAGPVTASFSWKEDGLNGIRRWLDKIYNIYMHKKINDQKETDKEFIIAHNKMICNVTKNIETLSLNLAISDMMVYINSCVKKNTLNKKICLEFITILSCFAPFLAEYLNQKLNLSKCSIVDAYWPTYDENLLVEKQITIPVQINGKHRCNLNVIFDTSKEKIIDLAKENDNIKKHLENKNVKKIIFIENKLLNFVVE